MSYFEASHADFLLVVVVLEVFLQCFGQRNEVDAVVRALVADHSTAQVLQGEGEVAVHGQRQHRLEEHAAAGVLVVLDQAAHSVRGEDARVMGVKAELVVPLLNTSMQ